MWDKLFLSLDTSMQLYNKTCSTLFFPLGTLIYVSLYTTKDMVQNVTTAAYLLAILLSCLNV